MDGAAGGAGLSPTAERFLDGFDGRAGLVVTRDGFIVRTDLGEAARAGGVVLGAASGDPEAEQLVGSVT
ncbi:MAG TPA: hypothetical protein VEH29_00505, partial [Acidimicrobiales bacterium]|nr:hypothetical protein [Acidimicrobiales bacterium]